MKGVNSSILSYIVESATLHYHNWDWKEAEDGFRLVLQISKGTTDPTLLRFRAISFFHLGDINRGSLKVYGEGEALDNYKDAYHIWEHLEDWENCVRCLHMYAQSLWRSARSEEDDKKALNWYHKALKLCNEKVRDPKGKESLKADIHRDIAITYIRLQQPGRAVPYLEKALRGLKGIDDPVAYGITFETRAQAYVLLNQANEALSDLDVAEDLIITHRYFTAKGALTRAEALVTKGEIEEAERLARQVRELSEDLPTNFVPTYLGRIAKASSIIQARRRAILQDLGPLRVIILGKYRDNRRQLLDKIREALPPGVVGVILDEEPDYPGEGFEAKFVRLATSQGGNTFIIAEASEQSAHILEVRIAAILGLPIARLRKKGKMDTPMQLDYSLKFSLRDFDYTDESLDLSDAVSAAVDWAKEEITHRVFFYEHLYRRKPT